VSGRRNRPWGPRRVGTTLTLWFVLIVFVGPFVGLPMRVAATCGIVGGIAGMAVVVAWSVDPVRCNRWFEGLTARNRQH
jgi:hypothetical protein